MDRKTIIGKASTRALATVRIDIRDYADADLVASIVAGAFSGYWNRATNKGIIEFEDAKQLFLKHVEERGIDISRYWNNGKPVTNAIKGIINRMIEHYKLTGKIDISRVMSEVRAQYIVGNNAALYVLPPSIIDDISVNDSRSCFKKNGCNRSHYRFLQSINEITQDSKFNYLLLDTGNEIARMLCIHNQDIAMIFNIYSDFFTKLAQVQHTIAGAIEIYKGWRLSRYKIIPAHMPIYLNDGEVLVCYNAERVANATIAREKLLLYTKGMCNECGDEICFIDAVSRTVDHRGFVLCVDCDENGNRITCAGCGGDIDEEDVYWYADEPYCEYCFYDFAFYCEYCGEAARLEYAYRGADDCLYCERCFRELFVECADCETVIRRSNHNDYYIVDSEVLCPSCFRNSYFICSGCGEYIFLDDRVEIGDNSFCPDCAEHRAQCKECKRVYRKDEMRYYEDTGWLCRECDRQIEIEYGAESEYEIEPIRCERCGEAPPIIYNTSGQGIQFNHLCMKCIDEIRKTIKETTDVCSKCNAELRSVEDRYIYGFQVECINCYTKREKEGE